MSVRLRKWTTEEGKVLERWTIDVKVALPGQRPRRIRDFSPVNTRRGARLTHNRVKDVVSWMCSKACLAKRLTTHDLRHTFASHLACAAWR